MRNTSQQQINGNGNLLVLGDGTVTNENKKKRTWLIIFLASKLEHNYAIVLQPKQTGKGNIPAYLVVG